MVVDTSALLAIYFDEPSAPWVIRQMESSETPVVMSTVNLCEMMILFRSRLVADVEPLEAALFSSGVVFIPPTVEHARVAAIARHRFPLNLGDCFAYALSVLENCSILTLDEDFRDCDRPVLIPPSRD